MPSEADPETDEVLAQVTLLPEINISQEENDAEMEPPFPPLPEFRVHSFCKTLTTLDASLHGGFSVPMSFADQCLPQLVHDMSRQPPSQELITRDLLGNQHLLTSGWKNFVNSKRLGAGDAFVFLGFAFVLNLMIMMRGENGELCVGVRHAMKPRSNVSASISISGMYLSVLATTWEALARRTIFAISYKPRRSPAEFIILIDQYMNSVKNNYSIGMRFQMKIN
ncbi:B3 DNA binding domain - like 10 [Theobroma cacao]|nr:B3 DNA binding domain - like 10 [Theobroma cacao]